MGSKVGYEASANTCPLRTSRTTAAPPSARNPDPRARLTAEASAASDAA